MRITKELNERLTRVGPGTPMGEVFRRYWIPACLAEELAEPDGAPVRVRLLGEDLVAFRDSAGSVGLVDAFCPHRRAPLFFGRNEECGLRCVYHGWKFDTEGNCVDMPSEPPVQQVPPPGVDQGLSDLRGGRDHLDLHGPARSARPRRPTTSGCARPPTHVRVSKTGEHVQLPAGPRGRHRHRALVVRAQQRPRQLADCCAAATPPRARGRRARLRLHLREPAQRQRRRPPTSASTSSCMPAQQIARAASSTLEGNPAKLPSIDGHIWVPIDDENTFVYNWMYSADERYPISDEYWTEHESEMGRGPGLRPRHLLAEAARPTTSSSTARSSGRKTFTGIEGINTQDFALQTGMGRIVDREPRGTRQHRPRHPGGPAAAHGGRRRGKGGPGPEGR